MVFNDRNEKASTSRAILNNKPPSTYPERAGSSLPPPGHPCKENNAAKTGNATSTPMSAPTPRCQKSSSLDRAPSGRPLSRFFPSSTRSLPAGPSTFSSPSPAIPAPTPVQGFRGYVYEPAPPGWDGGYGGATDVPRTKPIDIPNPERRVTPVFGSAGHSGSAGGASRAGTSSGSGYTGSSSGSSYTSYGDGSDTGRSAVSSFTSYTVASNNSNSSGAASATTWPGVFG